MHALMVHDLCRPKKSSTALKLNGNKAENILAMLSSGDTSQRGPLTVEGHVARVMKKLLDQVRLCLADLLISLLQHPRNSLHMCLQCCKHQPSSLKAKNSASRACLTAYQRFCSYDWEGTCSLLRHLESCSQLLCSEVNCYFFPCQMDKWEEKQEAARERKEAKQKERQVQLAQKTGKQPPPAAESVAK